MRRVWLAMFFFLFLMDFRILIITKRILQWARMHPLMTRLYAKPILERLERYHNNYSAKRDMTS